LPKALRRATFATPWRDTERLPPLRKIMPTV